MNDRPLLLDLFAGAGGAGEGYARAGFRVVGVDVDPRPLRHNPHECYVGDALAVLDALLAGGSWRGYTLRDFAAIHASPPCQEYSALRSLKTKRYVALIPQVRDRLWATGLPWILENVERAPMHQGVMICGTALGLNVRRHRLFDSSHFLWPPGPCHHDPDNINVYGHSAWNYRPRSEGWKHKFTRTNARQCPVPVARARAAFEAPWMTLANLAECIPPAYTHWVGAQLMTVLSGERGAA